jgi:HD-GYP domain-containing protein (c-di-GMP phosphodiesterase class II)
MNLPLTTESNDSMQTAAIGEFRLDEKLLQLSTQMDEFEGYSRPHGARIASIANAIASHFNLASDDRSFLNQAAYLHDIGEMIMGRDYIGAFRTLSPDERLDLQRHPVIGEQEIAKLGLPRGVQLLVRWHHEWWNGLGYPDGLEGEQIPLAARILRAADCYASLTGSRPFRTAYSTEEARKYVAEWAAIEFDPRVAKVLLDLNLADTVEEFAVTVEHEN